MIRASLLATLAFLIPAGHAAAQEPDADTNRRWEVSILDDWAALRWAIPDTDDAGVTYACDLRSGVVRALFYTADQPPQARLKPWPAKLEIRSGSLRLSAPAEGQIDDLTEGTVIEAKLPLNAPVLTAFAKTGALTLSAYGETSDAPPAPVADVAKFLEACRP